MDAENRQETVRQQLEALAHQFESEQHQVLAFGTQDYSKLIDIAGTVVNERSLSQAVAGENVASENIQSGDRGYLVLSIQNTGSSAAWGKLECMIAGSAITIHVPFLNPRKEGRRLFVVPLDGIPLAGADSGEIAVGFRWIVLCVKP